MSDVPYWAPNQPPRPPREPRPGERIFDYVRAVDGATIVCELRDHGKPFFWEAQFFAGGEFWYGRSVFTTRALALQWAEAERKNFEKGGSR